MRHLTQDHILFKEAIRCFNKEDIKKIPENLRIYKKISKENRIYGYLIFDFQLNQDIDCGDFIIHATKTVYPENKEELHITESGHLEITKDACGIAIRQAREFFSQLTDQALIKFPGDYHPRDL